MLCANKSNDMGRLQQQLQDLQKLLAVYESLTLTPEQQRQVNQVVSKYNNTSSLIVHVYGSCLVR